MSQAEPNKLPPGTVVNGRYQVLAPVGHGGLGTVYQVVDTLFGRSNVFALKEQWDQSPGARKQFMREAAWLKALNHRHIPKVTEYFEWHERLYLVMEFVEGENLERKLERAGGRPLPESQVIAWILPICDALQYLHTRTPPIIHRDIKPSNIIVTPAGYPVLVDLGIAKEHAPGTNATATFVRKAGTEGYAPPEQYAAAGQSGPWSDVYAVGATLYQLLTTQIPPTAVERVALDARLVRPSDVNPTVSVATDGAVLRALAVRPQDRFQSIVELARSLSSAAPASPPLPVSAPQPIAHAPGTAHSASTAQWPAQTPRQLAPIAVHTPASVPTPAAHAAVRSRDRRATRKVPALPEVIERDDNARPGALSRPGVWGALVLVFALITALAVVGYQHFFAPLDRSMPIATVTGYYNALVGQNYNLAWQYTTSSANDQSSQGAIIANMKADDTRGGPIVSFHMSALQGDASSHVTTTVTVNRARAPGEPAVYVVYVTQYGSIWLIDSVTAS